MASTQYIVQQGERWDSIAYKAYGRPGLIKGIVEANPLVPITARLEGGIVLTIPVLDEVNVQTDAERLPPWKRID